VSQEVAHSTSQVPGVYRGESWDELTQEAHEVFGADLEKGQQLIGVPMCLVQATFRRGDFADKNGEKGFYVSLDTIIAPAPLVEKAVKRGRIPEENWDYIRESVGDHLIFNEGGTGVYRQVVAYLEATERIQIKSDLGREGAYGESRFDTSPEQWTVDDSAELKRDEDGSYAVAFAIRLLCPRGLRSSEYANEYTKAGVTRYIA
jgi:hypothetical protein